jgi:AGZA family xanthine/uracil permease-like MFS transporter
MAAVPHCFRPDLSDATPTSVTTEVLAGLTTFFTMAYIVIVNPSILSTDGTGIPFSGALTATVLICFTMTLFMGVYARLPFAVAPGMGINAFFTFTLILGHQIPWRVALGMVFWSGAISLVIAATRMRETIARSIPSTLRAATAVGIGIFLTFIGLRNAGLIAADPVTFVRLGTLDHRAPLTLVGMSVAVWLEVRRSPFALLAGIFAVTMGAWFLGEVSVPPALLSAPDFGSVFLQLDILGALQWSLAPAIVSLLFTDLFDSISTFMGVAQATNLLDKKGDPIRLREGMIVDGFGSLGASLAGSSSGTAYIESAAGISAGGRTGLTAVVTALCFLPCFFLAPIAGMVPPYASAAVLVMIGASMFRSVSSIDLSKIEDSLPAFLTIILIPLTFSITQGILWGFISHVLLYLIVGRRREIHPVMFGLALLAIALLVIEHT